MSERNPYAPSQATLKRAPAIGGKSANVWRDGKWLVMDVDARLPHRCIKCNEPAALPLKQKTLYWHHPALYLLLLLWIVIYIAFAFTTRKTIKLEVGLCEEHKRARRNALLGGFIGLFGSIPAAVVLAKLDLDGLSLSVGFFGFLGSVIYLMIKARLVYAKKIDLDEARVGGCGEQFLASLPRYR